MRQGQGGRRPRGRPNRKQHGGGSSRPHSFDSNGPEGRVRGNAHQVYERYVALARDALSAGDRIAAETYYQHAEHYFRIMNASTDPTPEQIAPKRVNEGDRAAGAVPAAETAGADDEIVAGVQPQPSADTRPQAAAARSGPSRTRAEANGGQKGPRRRGRPRSDPRPPQAASAGPGGANGTGEAALPGAPAGNDGHGGDANSSRGNGHADAAVSKAVPVPATNGEVPDVAAPPPAVAESEPTDT